MTDLQINVALAKAMGWDDDDISSSFYSQNLEAYDWDKNGWRKFDYRDPVIFDAIITHWFLEIDWFTDFFTKESFVNIGQPAIGVMITRPKNERYKAAALCVIDAVERGFK